MQDAERNGFRVSIIVTGAFLGVLAVIGLIFWFHSSPVSDSKSTYDKPQSLIKEVASAPAPVAKTNESVRMVRNKRTGELEPWKPKETYRDQNGVLRFAAGGARAPEKDEFKNAIPVNTPSSVPKFRHRSEVEIAVLLKTQPGEMLFGTPSYDKHFKDDFVKALMEPVEITEEDSEDDVALKKLVEEEKHELAKRIKDGENIETIFSDCRDELRRLATVKREILDLAHKAAKDGEMSDADVEDYYRAANLMLESKGLAPVNVDSLMKRRLRYMNRRGNKQ